MISRFLTIASSFTAIFFDQYGVLHDGHRAYPGAREALAALKSGGVKIVILSNSGRTSQANARRAAALGFGPELYDHFVTSGDVARRLLKRGGGPAPLTPETRCLTISSHDDDDFPSTLGLASASDGAVADLVIISGSQGDRPSLDEYRRILAPAAMRGAPCVCTNPDKLMLTPTGIAPGAGRIAELYQELGGEVKWIGKPFPQVYQEAAALCGVEGPREILCVGDSVEHDVVGAHGFGAAAALLRCGILATLSEAELAHEIGKHGAVPDFVLKDLTLGAQGD
jgi:HAD superfamily hydrolase (TIGR01459 family)